MTEEQRRVVLDHALGRAPEAQVRRAFEPLPLDSSGSKSQLLQDAVASRDAREVEYALMLCGMFGGFSVDQIEILTVLLIAPWHIQHENIASALQRLRAPATADALARAALMKHEYLAYNDSHAFARKCTWALADIGTPEARAHLERLARAEDEEIASYAQKRLDDWEDELSRKGWTPSR
jgi:hypothetical protein